MHSLRILFIAAFIIISQKAFMQGISGRLTDKNNNPVPFAAVYDESSYAGTTSNSEGYYDLKLSAGKHQIIFKSLGYYVERRLVTVSSTNITLNLQLSEQAYELKDVVVTPGKEDPAYAIMRKAIGFAPYHLNQVKEYVADVYLRGSMNIIQMPKFISKRIEINGKKGVLKNGDVFLQESINEIGFKAPASYDQKVKSFRSNFPGENKVSPMQIITASFYSPKIDEAVSPLAPDAFSFYKFRYEGFSNEGEFTIFKIKVIPKRKSQQLMSGDIYIIDQLWSLHSVDVSQEMFFGKLEYKEIFSPVKDNAWLPISYIFRVNASIMGIKADYKYTSSVKYSKVVLNEKTKSKPAKVAEAKEPLLANTKKPSTKKQKAEQEIERLASKEKLNNREMVKLATLMSKEVPVDSAKSKSLEIKDEYSAKVTIEKDAMKKDTAYWNTVRPIPLTALEATPSNSIKSPVIGDSLKNDTISRDTTNRKKKKEQSAFQQFVFGEKHFTIIKSKVYLNYNGLLGLNRFDFNTVDGFVYKQAAKISINTDSTHKVEINPEIGYAFSRKAFMSSLSSSYKYAPLKNGILQLNYSNSSVDYNPQGPLNNQINALASLFFRRNYKKFYGSHQVSLSNSVDISNGLRFNGSLGFRKENILVNNSDFSFFYRDSREYTQNIPINNFEALNSNMANSEAYVQVGLEYTPMYYYRIFNGKKYYQYSKFPTFFTNYKKAIPGVFSSTANFDFLEIGARQVKSWGLMHSFSYNITAGKYLSTLKLYLSDYKFFNNQPLPLIIGNTRNSFFLPQLYENYTRDSFLEGHIVFTTPYLLLKYLPFLSSKMWLENLQLNYLTTSSVKNYWEAGYSISHIYAVGGIGVFAGFKETKFQGVGVRFTIGF